MDATITTEEARDCAEVIRAQLGGRRFDLMTGSKNFFFDTDGGLAFQVGRNSEGVTMCRIELDRALDLYTMVFFKGRGIHTRECAKIERVCCDQLTEVFTRHTGLYTSL